jgi:hypothetical protein
VEAELQRMVDLGVVSKINAPTEWCAGMVVVPKQNGAVRICVDLTKLNKSVRRERLIILSVDYILAQIGEAKCFSKLDLLTSRASSAKLTTFITPFGRFCFALYHVSTRAFSMMELLQGLDGIVGIVDDFLIHGKTKQEHDARLLSPCRLSRSGLTLNREKCEFGKTLAEVWPVFSAKPAQNLLSWFIMPKNRLTSLIFVGGSISWIA